MTAPANRKGQAIPATTSAVATLLTGDPAVVAALSEVQLYNPGPLVVNVLAGGASVVADATCWPLDVGQQRVCPTGGALYLSIYCASGTQQVVAVGAGATPAAPTGNAPEFKRLPLILGTPTIGVAASFLPGDVTGAATITRAQQWYMDDVAVSTAATYTPTGAGVLTVKETATNSVGSRPAISAGVLVKASGGGGGGGGSTFPTFTGTVKVADIGDSITAFENYGKAAAGVTITRAADGAIDVPLATNVLYGFNNVYINNAASDHSFEVAGRNVYAASNIDLAAATHLPSSAAAIASPPGATSTTLDTNGRITSWDRHDNRGTWYGFNGALKGGVEFIGNFGHGGILAPITSKIAYMLSFNPDLVRYRCGVNNAKASAWASDAAADAAAASTWLLIKQDLDQITGLDGGGGNKPVLVHFISPVGTAVGQYARVNMRVIGEPDSGQSGYLATSLNARIATYIAANPTKMLGVNEWANSIDKVTDPANWQIQASLSTDGTHWKSSLCYTNGVTSATTFGAYYAPVDYLPRQSSDTAGVNGHTRVSVRGPWFGGATVAASFTGSSGTLPSGWNGGRQSGSGTVAFSLVDPGDSKRMQLQCVFSPVASDVFVVWPHLSTGATLASLGLAIGDKVDMAFQVNYSGGTAAGLSLIQAAVPYLASASQYGTMGETVELTAGNYPDVMANQVFRTGWCEIGLSSNLVPGILVKFGNVASGTMTMTIECLVLTKK